MDRLAAACPKNKGIGKMESSGNTAALVVRWIGAGVLGFVVQYLIMHINAFIFENLIRIPYDGSTTPHPAMFKLLLQGTFMLIPVSSAIVSVLAAPGARIAAFVMPAVMWMVFNLTVVFYSPGIEFGLIMASAIACLSVAILYDFRWKLQHRIKGEKISASV